MAQGRVLLQVRLSKKLHQRVRRRAVAAGVSMTRYTVLALRDRVRKSVSPRR